MLNQTLKTALEKVSQLPPEKAATVLKKALAVLEEAEDLEPVALEHRFVMCGGGPDRSDVVVRFGRDYEAPSSDPEALADDAVFVAALSQIGEDLSVEGQAFGELLLRMANPAFVVGVAQALLESWVKS